MGVLNVTPDSFYDGGRYVRPEQALKHASRLVEEGADLIDVGAESTRPRAVPVSEKEELSRLLPVLDALYSQIHVPISIDTTKSRVAREALKRGVDIVNDVSGLRADPQMADVVRDFGAGIVVMHSRGTAETMQSLAIYEDLVREIIQELTQSIQIATSRGIRSDQIVIDPGIGFAKTAEQSAELLQRLNEFQSLGRPVLVGPSRKSFIGAMTMKDSDRRLFGTVSACVMALERGARIFRVHDVDAVREALLVTDSILASRHSSRGVSV